MLDNSFIFYSIYYIENMFLFVFYQRRQVVSQQNLDLPCEGSIPSAGLEF